MRSEKMIQEQKKGVLDFLNVETGLEKEIDKGLSFNFSPERVQEREEIFKRLEDSFPGDSLERKELFRENLLKDKLFWFFIEYFFLNSNTPLKELIDGLEKSIILRTLHEVNWNQKEAANILKMKCSTLNEKIKRYDIRFRKNPF
jgi:transcriptional regulator of acetoin/glycerol metabolism